MGTGTGAAVPPPPPPAAASRFDPEPADGVVPLTGFSHRMRAPSTTPPASTAVVSEPPPAATPAPLWPAPPAADSATSPPTAYNSFCAQQRSQATLTREGGASAVHGQREGVRVGPASTMTTMPTLPAVVVGNGLPWLWTSVIRRV